MKNHGDFTGEVQTATKAAIPDANAAASLANKIVALSRMGIAPEALGDITVNAIVDSIYRLNSAPYQPKPAQPPETIPPPPKFSLGSKSQGLLAFVIPSLAKVVERAIQVTPTDFTVTQTIRSLEDQRTAVATGHSRTMQSLHLKQADGFAHAVDLAAWVDGKISWVDDLYADLAFAMDRAATEQGVAQHIRWGGAWDRRLSDFGGSHAAYLKEIQDYRVRHPGSDLIDQPHFEWQA